MLSVPLSSLNPSSTLCALDSHSPHCCIKMIGRNNLRKKGLSGLTAPGPFLTAAGTWGSWSQNPGKKHEFTYLLHRIPNKPAYVNLKSVPFGFMRDWVSLPLKETIHHQCSQKLLCGAETLGTPDIFLCSRVCANSPSSSWILGWSLPPGSIKKHIRSLDPRQLELVNQMLLFETWIPDPVIFFFKPFKLHPGAGVPRGKGF